jgi:hypothetical protein
MHASEQHKKIEFALTKARDRIAHAETFLGQEVKTRDEIASRVSQLEESVQQKQDHIDREIRQEIDRMNSIADGYFKSFDT